MMKVQMMGMCYGGYGYVDRVYVTCRTQTLDGVMLNLECVVEYNVFLSM
jgi:hypothetical protein